jgi:hypothetical protein
MLIEVNIPMDPRTRAAFRHWFGTDDREVIQARFQADVFESIADMVKDYLESERPEVALREERDRLQRRLVEIDKELKG